jgi:hypothetical protein
LSGLQSKIEPIKTPSAVNTANLQQKYRLWVEVVVATKRMLPGVTPESEIASPLRSSQ